MSAGRRITAVARVELLRLLRSRMTFTLLLLVPAFQVLLFGYAIRPSPDSVSVAIAAPTPASARTIEAALSDQPGLRIVAAGLTPGGAEAMVRGRTALIGIEVPRSRGFGEVGFVQQPLRIVADGATASLTAAAVPRLEAAYWRELAVRADIAGNGPGIAVERLFNPDQRADWTYLPSLIGVTVMIAMIMLGCLGIAREREGGTWEALVAMPFRRVELLLGKLLPHAVIGAVQGVSVLAIGLLLFDLPARGSVVALMLILPLFAAAHLVLGHVIASRAASQLAALQGAVAFYLPAMLLSGFLYPFETLPGWAQSLGSIFPLTHFVAAAQGALLRGDDAPAVLAHALPIAAFLAVVTPLALLSHARRLD